MPPEPVLEELPEIEAEIEAGTDDDTEIDTDNDFNETRIYFSNREKICEYTFAVISTVFMDPFFDIWNERHLTNLRYFLAMADDLRYISTDFSEDLNGLRQMLNEMDLFFRQTNGIISNYNEKRFLNRALTEMFDAADSLDSGFQFVPSL